MIKYPQSCFQRGIAVLDSQRRKTSSLGKLKETISTQISEIKAAGTWKEERIILGKQAAVISVLNQRDRIINFCANNYLGLSSHPEVIEAGLKALKEYGSGLSSVRFICGTLDIHRELEHKIARFHSRDDAILYAACFDANAGIFEALLGQEDAIISDELNHASIIDGIRLSKAQRYRYRNRDMADLEECLQKSHSTSRHRLIVTDGVFSMDGVVTPLREISELADKYNAQIFIDECHATGFFGKTGRGTEEHFGLDPKKHVDIINSTLGKALGGAAGGYTTGPQWLIDFLRQRSRPYLFSNSLPPAVVACASKALDLVMNNPDLNSKLQINTKHFRNSMQDAGFTVAGDSCHPICPVMLGDAKVATEFAKRMLSKGIYVVGFSYPVVPKGKARIRVQISAVHETQHIDQAIEAFISVGRDMNVLPARSSA